MKLKPGVYEVSPSEGERLRAEATAVGATVYLLSDDEIVDHDSFFDAVRATLPLDPPLVGYYNSWDALSDSICGGLDALKTPRILMIWSNSDRFKESPVAFDLALSVLREVTETLASEELTVGNPKEVTVLLT